MILLPAIVLPILLAVSSASPLIDENLAVDSWMYELVRDLDLRGIPLTEFSHERPLAAGDIAAALEALDRRIASGEIRPTPIEIQLINALRRELETEIRSLHMPDAWALGISGDGRYVRNPAGEGRWRGQGVFEAALKLDSRTTLYNRSWLDTRVEDDPSLAAVPWKGDAGGVTDAAYLLRHWARGSILVGRQRMDWGPGFHGGLLFSAGAPPLDMLKADIRVSRFQATAFTAVLDDYAGSYAGETVHAARYLSGHRLAWRPGPSLEVSASELILYGGEGRLPEIRYVVPLFFFYGEQWNSAGDDNPFWAFDVSWRPWRGTRLYGEYLIDDFQYDSDAEPNEIGFVVGGETADPPGLSGAVFGLEYARVNRWTYGQNKPWNRYVQHGFCIGHPLGPDADGLWARLSRPVTGAARVQVELARVRKGEGRIEDDRSSVVPFTERFPSGVVETCTTLAFSIEVFPGANRWMSGEIGWARTENSGHLAGRDDTGFEAEIRARVGFENLWGVR
jgi:hypothetical protein